MLSSSSTPVSRRQCGHGGKVGVGLITPWSLASVGFSRSATPACCGLRRASDPSGTDGNDRRDPPGGCRHRDGFRFGRPDISTASLISTYDLTSIIQAKLAAAEVSGNAASSAQGGPAHVPMSEFGCYCGEESEREIVWLLLKHAGILCEG